MPSSRLREFGAAAAIADARRAGAINNVRGVMACGSGGMKRLRSSVRAGRRSAAIMRHLFPTVCLTATIVICHAATAGAETSISFYSGTSDTADADLRIREPGTDSDAKFHGVSWRARPFEDSPYYGIRLTYFPTSSSRVGGSFDFTHYKIFAETERTLTVDGIWNGVPVSESVPMNRRVQQFEVSHGLNLAALNLIYRWPMRQGRALPETRWQLYVGAGLLAYVPHAEATINGSFTSADYQFAGFGYQALAGLQCRVSRRVSLFAEVKQDGGKLNIDLQGGTQAKARVRTIHALAGMAVSLGRPAAGSSSGLQSNHSVVPP